MTRFYVSLRASSASAAINRQRIPSERSKTVDCFANARNDDDLEIHRALKTQIQSFNKQKAEIG
ncbi:MAG: hypothetical protein K2N54_03705 [Helicobacter sp.]|nr:hypothetical protein [Helicobacter sp.]